MLVIVSGCKKRKMIEREIICGCGLRIGLLNIVVVIALKK